MKTKFRFFVLMGLMLIIPGLSSFGQVAINTTGAPPENSAMLDISSSSRGLLMPRMTQSQIESMKDPADGLLVYCTTSGKVYLFIGTSGQWKEMDFGLGVISPWECGLPFTVNHTAGAVAPVNKSVTYGTVTNLPGEPSKCWITSNLGSDHQAAANNDTTEASAGWYWQFNRMQGYKHTGLTRTPGTAWNSNINENLDWQSANDPCALLLGNGWRIPTLTEWVNVDAGGGWDNWNETYSSALKLHAAGYLEDEDGRLVARPYGSYYGPGGYYWSNTQSIDNPSYLYRLGWFLQILSASCGTNGNWNKSHGFSVRCINSMETPAGYPDVTTDNASYITQTSARCGGNITSAGDSPVTARGVCWSTTQNPKASGYHTSDGSGIGTFTSNITGLTANTTYYVRAYATNSTGTAYGNEIVLSTYTCGYITVTHTAGAVAPVTKTVTYETVTNIPGETSKCWLASNLGADHKATAVSDATEPSAGWYWQFNRKQGYKAEGSTVTPSWPTTPIDENSEWISENDPCRIELGSTWRIPTFTEWLNVDMGWNIFTDPWNAVLKLHAAGYITSGGSLIQTGSYGRYWSSTQFNGTDGYDLCFLTESSNTENMGKVFGTTLRCIK